MKKQLLIKLGIICGQLGISTENIRLDWPESFENGDFTTNVALTSAKQLKMSPKALAEKILSEFEKFSRFRQYGGSRVHQFQG